MRILLVAPEPCFDLRGTPINVLQMCRALTGSGHEVHLATYPLGRRVGMPGLTVHRSLRPPGLRRVPIGFSFRKILLDATLAATVLRLLLTRRFDVVHAVEEAVFFCLPPARLARRPVVWDLDSVISDQLRYEGVIRSRWLLGLIRRIEAAALRRCACALTVCGALTGAVRAASPATPVFQIEDAPLEDTPELPGPDETGRLRRELGLEGRRIVAYTGNFQPYQGVDLLVEAMAEVLDEVPEAVLLLVGGEQREIGEMALRAAGAGVAERVRFLGTQPPEKTTGCMAIADVLVSPRREGANTPLKIYGYMQAGRPIVATDRQTHTQVLDDSTAFLVPATAAGLARGIVRALTDAEGARRRAEAARARVERDFSFDVFSRKLGEVYRFLGEGRSSEPAGPAPVSAAGP